MRESNCDSEPWYESINERWEANETFVIIEDSM